MRFSQIVLIHTYGLKMIIFKIYLKLGELNMIDNELEIVLKDLELDDLAEDWYVNLQKSSKDN